MTFKKVETPLLNEVVTKSVKACLLVRLSILTPMEDDEVLKSFVMWSSLKKDPNGKGALCNHKVHSSWNPDDGQSLEFLARGLLIQIISKLGLDRVQEILTEFRIGAPVDDTQDYVN